MKDLFDTKTTNNEKAWAFKERIEIIKNKRLSQNSDPIMKPEELKP